MFNKNKAFAGKNYMELTPIRNYEHIVKDNGLIDVLVPRFTGGIMGKLLMPKIKNKFIKANLDDIGSQTWLLLDGNAQVHQISDLLSEKFGERVEPSIDRLTKFLTQLYKNNFITFKEIRKD